MARFIIYGAGAIGGTLGAGLFEAGFDTILIARGAHYAAVAEGGLRVATPSGNRNVRVPIVDHPDRIDFSPDDIVLLTMKSQDSPGALEALRPLLAPTTPICCVQNAVENERLALRIFENVYGVLVICPATHLEPGVVVASSEPILGVLDIGRFPVGIDDVTTEIAAAFNEAGFSSAASPNIMDWKYAKLLGNLNNAVDAVFGLDARSGEIPRHAREEGIACLAAAGISYVPEARFRERSAGTVTSKPVAGLAQHGSSSWQSIARQSGSIESDYLNGEVVLLGRTYSVATPINAALQRLANERVQGIATDLNEAEFLRIAIDSVD